MRRFQDILNKYVGQINDLGNGNFGLREGFLIPFLYITTPFPNSGELIIRNSKFGECWDCLRTAYRIGKELEAEGFDVKYRAKRTDESVQNYVEVKNPETGEWIQIDATPWYRRLNPGHKATIEHPRLTQDDMEKVKISKWQGQMLSVEELADNLFVETYLSGGYKTQGDIISSDKSRELPDYSLRLWSRLCKSVVDKTMDRVDLSVDIIDSNKTSEYKSTMQEGQWLTKPEQVLRNLQEQGTIRLSVESYVDVLTNIGNHIIGNGMKPHGKEDLVYLDQILRMSPSSEPVVRNLRRNFDCLVNLLLNCRPSITTTNGRQIVYVKFGGVSSVPGRY